MSGALIQLVSKGVQDVYLMSDEGHSFFRSKFTRHTNFSQVPKYIKTITDTDSSITIPVFGDIINGIWFESDSNSNDNIASNLFYNSTIDLYIGGQKIDSQHYDYFSEIWPNYLADTYNKAKELNTKASLSNRFFVPLHFFFCDHKAFLPLVALQNHQTEIRITFNQSVINTLPESEKKALVYGNYIFLDKDERESLVRRPMDFVITQTQRLEFPLNAVTDNINESGGYNDLDISSFNHPVKSIFFGFGSSQVNPVADRFTFTKADIYINGTPLIENMSPVYFHTAQNYFKSTYGRTYFNQASHSPIYTRYFAYHFCMNASDYNPSGSCNFSRIDNSKIIVRGVEAINREHMYVYAVNYNVLRIKDGLAGILFGN